MKKILPIILIVGLLFSGLPVQAFDTVYRYFIEKTDMFPTVQERTPLAELGCGIVNYEGTFEQNIEFLECLRIAEDEMEEMIFGATIPIAVAFFETSLATSITASSTSLTLIKGTDAAGDSLSGYTCFIINEGESNEETVCGTAAGTSITSLLRGISPIDGDLEVYALIKSHRRGSSVKITNHPQLAIVSRIVNGDEGVPNALYYDSQPTFTADEEIITKKYADDLAIAGSPAGSTTTAGIFEIADTNQLIHFITTTGETGKLLIPYLGYFATSTDKRGATTTVMMTDTDGKMDQSFIDKTEAFSWSGIHIFSSSTTFSESTTFSSSTTFSASTTLATTTLDGELAVTQDLIVSGGNSRMATTTFTGIPTLPAIDATAANQAVRQAQLMQAESGTGARAANTAASSSWVVMSGAFKPTIIKITAYRHSVSTGHDASTMAISHGLWDDVNGQVSVMIGLLGTNDFASSASNATDIIYLCGYAAGTCDTVINATLTTPTSTDGFALAWDTTPGDTNVVRFFWEAYK